MTNLKEVHFGLNQYCGPAVLSALTGEDTDRCAAVISAVSGRREIKAVSTEHLREALKRLRFDVKETIFSGSSLYGTLFRMHSHDGLYIVFVPHHVIAIEVKGTEIYICDNHTKTPLDIKQSARLTQKVSLVWKVERKEEPKFVDSSIQLVIGLGNVEVNRFDSYENQEDNSMIRLGRVNFGNKDELIRILEAFRKVQI